MRYLRFLASVATLALAAIVAPMLAPAPLGAQVVETPAAFDSAGRVLAITPALAARLRLASPAWPVDGAYVEARLYRLGSTEDRVLVVHRAGGALERRPLSIEQFRLLRESVDAGTRAGDRPVGEERANEISESARGRFIRNQLAAAATIYGGSLAELTDDEKAGTAVYLLSVGGAFFTAATLARRINVSKAQDHLTSDAAFRGSLAARGIAYALGVDGEEVRSEPTGGCDPVSGYCSIEDGYDDRDEDILAASILIGGIGGSVAAFNYGRGLTDGEARASTFGSTVAALTATGLLGTAGVFNDGTSRGTRRAAVAAIVGAGLAGYPLGLRYPRSAPYSVTSGDIGTLGVTGTLGVLAALSPLASSENISGNVASAVMTAGYLGGLVVGDRVLVRTYDFTDGEATLVGLGALAGGLMSVGVMVLLEPGENAGALVMSSITGGAILGVAATVRLVEPRRAGQPRVSVGPGGGRRVGLRGERPRVQVAPEGIALAAAGMRGRHSILRVTF